MPITKEDFVYYIDTLKQIRNASDRLNDALASYDETADFGGFTNFRVLILVEDLLNNLFKLERDEYGYTTISYFIEELNFGEDWGPECFQEADGTPIDISTSEKLYDYLEKECRN